MTNCTNCDAELAPKANFCSKCGVAVGEVVKEEFKIESDDLVKTVKKLIHEGNVRRIIIKDEKGKVLLEIPVTIGVIGVIIAPWLAALGAIGAIATKCTIEVVRINK